MALAAASAKTTDASDKSLAAHSEVIEGTRMVLLSIEVVAQGILVP